MPIQLSRRYFILGSTAFALTACGGEGGAAQLQADGAINADPSKAGRYTAVDPNTIMRNATPDATSLIKAARAQIGITLTYDPAYTALDFPNGDVSRETGVCTDVVIRAYRDALNADLQALVNADMKAAFSVYPRNWGLSRPDSNIDHRRVPNLEVFLARKATKLPLTNTAENWQPGDIFTSRVGRNLPHIGIVSDRLAANGNPLVIHNIGGGTQEEDILFRDKLIGHFRWKV